MPCPWRNINPEAGSRRVKLLGLSLYADHHIFSGFSSKDPLHSHREDFPAHSHLSSPPLPCPLLPLALAGRGKTSHSEIPQTLLPYNTKGLIPTSVRRQERNPTPDGDRKLHLLSHCSNLPDSAQEKKKNFLSHNVEGRGLQRLPATSGEGIREQGEVLPMKEGQKHL